MFIDSSANLLHIHINCLDRFLPSNVGHETMSPSLLLNRFRNSNCPLALERLNFLIPDVSMDLGIWTVQCCFNSYIYFVSHPWIYILPTFIPYTRALFHSNASVPKPCRYSRNIKSHILRLPLVQLAAGNFSLGLAVVLNCIAYRRRVSTYVGKQCVGNKHLQSELSF